MKKSAVRLALLCILISAVSLFSAGCQTVQSTYDRTREMLGIQKRAIMLGKVEDARQSLEEVKVRFQSTLERFNTVLNGKEGKLEEKYKTLKSEFEKTEKKAGDIQNGIDSVMRAAELMFAEWEAELNEYHSENLRSGSEQRMQVAKNQNTQFINAMTRANEKAGPVLAAFSDLVLFSRHNLNSGAAEPLKIELDAAAEKVDSLIQEIDASIGEADAFVSLLAGSEPAPQD
jgi:hypothetical protein